MKLADEAKVGLVSVASAAAIAFLLRTFLASEATWWEIAWKASMPLIVYCVYLIKLRVRHLRDDPFTLSAWMVFGSGVVVVLSALHLI